jgi:hypothetical protein
MSRVIIKYLNPWKYRRLAEAERLAALRQRDGDQCRRCKRPLRFDLPAGHDLGVRIEAIRHGANGGTEALDNFCLTHGRCNALAGDDTREVAARARVKNEAALFAKARKKRAA